jgi:hypothetical protein
VTHISDRPAPEAAPELAPEVAPDMIDLQQLAEKVYRLLLDDLRLDQARGAQAPRRRVRR